ncbi:MAG TPA: pyridoxamine 5'-phosphate oxidase family protein [Miltoncostaeaceae bacterium]|nr:pyridoxamine 5'-phosphate oxidase family protein [Miltoncostaeaceae bacterium]
MRGIGTIWSEFEAGSPDLAAFAAARLQAAVAFLATTGPDGWPRVHPVSPLIRRGRLLVFMEPTSPKGRDLRLDPRYALHAGVEDARGGGGEVAVRGRARPLEDPAIRTTAAGPSTQDRWVLFELLVDRVLATRYGDDGKPVRRRWNAPTETAP